VVRTLSSLEERTRMVRAVCRVDDPLAAEPPLLPGMYVEAVIDGRRREDLVRLPVAALRQDDTVFVVDLDDTLHPRDVELVSRTNGEVLVTGDLQDGERVLVTVLPEAHDGMLVRLPEPAPTADDRQPTIERTE